jgi:hypothetical protein
MRPNKNLILLFGLFIFTGISSAQNDTSGVTIFQSLFGTNRFIIDSSAVPEDPLTQKIRVLRSERGPINFENVIKFTIRDQQSKDTTRPKEYYDKFLEECQTGNAHRNIENVLINLYRQCFTEEEVDQLVEFYKSTAGKKMFKDFLLLTAIAANTVQDILKLTAEKLDKEMNIEKKKNNK